jgi:hypothetical protein
MERRNLIRVIPAEKTAPAPEGSLSERFAGALHLSALSSNVFDKPFYWFFKSSQRAMRKRPQISKLPNNLRPLKP